MVNSFLAKTTLSQAGAFMRLPVGYDDFKAIVDRGMDFVDKSLLIQEILDDVAQVAVITRPRRFGKTLNLSMLHYFLAAKAHGQSTQNLFEGLKITALGDDYMQHQGRYPVIFVTFKEVKNNHFEAAYGMMKKLMSQLYREYQHELPNSPRLTSSDKEKFLAVLEERVDEPAVRSALVDLCYYLYQHYQVKPWLLIDEYDTPIQAAYVHNYYDPMLNLMRGIFGAALKTNPYLEKAVITGILRVAKESLFSGLNNLEVYTLTNSKYGQYFGFTEDEVENLLQQAGLQAQAPAIRDWYNGYKAGTYTVYNPWSIVKCIREQGELAPYWVNTSDNHLIKTLLLGSSEGFRTQFEDLLQGKTIEKTIDETLAFADLNPQRGRGDSAGWSLLFAAGYLKVVSSQRVEEELQCQLDIPNREVRGLYRQIIREWLADGHDTKWFDTFLNHLLTGDLIAFEHDLKQLVEQTFSVHDTSKDSEVFYHGFMIGATASLYHNKNYEIKSNRESGYGRYDYMIFSHDENKLTILIELKRVPKETPNFDQALEQAAQHALEQMELQNYAAEARQRGRTKILQIGLAFSGKRFILKSTSPLP